MSHANQTCQKMFDNNKKRMATDKESDTTQARVQFFGFFLVAGRHYETHSRVVRTEKKTYLHSVPRRGLKSQALILGKRDVEEYVRQYLYFYTSKESKFWYLVVLRVWPSPLPTPSKPQGYQPSLPARGRL